tara:strand:+ start:21381 stop:21737 length:357 start_codon:yes stop_codon:yes gene_type:complete
MPKCDIKCKAIDYHNDVRRWEVTPEGIVWPCCFFSNAWDMRNVYKKDGSGQLVEKDTKDLKEDTRIMTLMENDPNWNNLEHHSLEEIIAHEIFQTHVYYEGWKSDMPPKVCVNNCSNN